MEKARNWGVQFYDREAHDYLWLGGCDRMGYPETQFPTEEDANQFIDANKYERRPLWKFDSSRFVVRSDYQAVEVPE